MKNRNFHDDGDPFFLSSSKSFKNKKKTTTTLENDFVEIKLPTINLQPGKASILMEPRRQQDKSHHRQPQIDTEYH